MSKLIKIILVVLPLVLVGCKEEERKRGRILTRNVEFSKLRTQNFPMPDGNNFDLESVLESQMLSEFDSTGYFTVLNAIDIAATSDIRPSNLAFNGSAGKCMAFAPFAKIIGDAKSFELEGSGGVNIGYGTSGPIQPPGAVKFSLESMSMEMGFEALDPYTGRSIKAVNITERKLKVGGGFSINLGAWTINPEAFFSSPISKVTRKALRSAITELGESIDQDYSWHTTVTRNLDSHIEINAGASNGVKVGDTFWISNVDYNWEGEPCKSRLLGDSPRSNVDSPLAIVQVEKVGQVTSVAKIRNEVALREEIAEGARVYIYMLVPDKNNDPAPYLPNPLDRL